jgi:hypothetical protein
MRIGTIIGSSSLFLLLGIAAPTWAQDQHPQEQPAEKAKEPAEKSKEQPAEKAKDPKAPHDGPTRQNNEPPKNPNEQPHPNDKQTAPPRDENTKNDAGRTGEAGRSTNANRNGDAGRNGQESARGGGKRIPEEKFKASFGREHSFHVGHPQVVDGRPRFQYGGYSFFILQEWPRDWGYDDDVYVIDVDGVYYLVDAVHPGIQLSLDLVL